ncbi:hypothetical protein EVAR_5374_1 [Eumeta japonica]|uniref:MICOS complex subunit n=1 Tax=Eumeta variegata TaxID=151549 RepID=A0A4C1TN84_EUMVA|nr:hypothetical protein EVAR_5374_1 [Eumeta japonica]
MENQTVQEYQVSSTRGIINTLNDHDIPGLVIEKPLDLPHRGLVDAVMKEIMSMRFTFIPTVKAAPPPTPEKPPPMKRSELPIDKKPHCDYNEYQDTLKLCPEFETKIINGIVYPYVCEYRRSLQDGAIATYEASMKGTKALACAVSAAKKDLKEYMKSPENVQLRTCVTVGGVITGFLSAYNKGIPKKLLFSGIGLLATGAMCFPKETDEGFRKFCYHLGTFFLSFANFACRQSWQFKWRGTCKTVGDDSVNCEVNLGDGKLKK